MFVDIYLHGSKEEMYAIGEKLGLEGPALENFMYSCYEVKVGLEVETNGFSKIVEIDGQGLILCSARCSGIPPEEGFQLQKLKPI